MIRGNDYRGVILPEGMTPQCLDELASIFNDYGDGLLKVGDEEASPTQAAVAAFELMRRLCPSQTQPSQSPRSGE